MIGEGLVAILVTGPWVLALAFITFNFLQRRRQRPLWISLEANIAAGKTTLLGLLVPELRARDPRTDYILCPEPVEQWERAGLLALSYENPDKYLFPAQCFFFSTRIDAICAAFASAAPGRPTVILSERSPFSDSLFASISNRFDVLLADVYKGIWSHFQRILPVAQPDAFVYLRPSIGACMERLQKRARASEKTVTLDYQQQLRNAHDSAFLLASGAIMPNGARVPVLVLDTDENFHQDAKKLGDMVNRIEALIKRLQ
jgi:deoxyadenosine/deoxycytidine kinase